jgi:uncharacterized protein YcaQ
MAISEAGAWKYSFVYDLTHRYYPDLLTKAREISENQAMDYLLTRFFASLGAATVKQAVALFNWLPELTQRSINRLVKSGHLLDNIKHEKQTAEFFTVKQLVPAISAGIE